MLSPVSLRGKKAKTQATGLNLKYNPAAAAPRNLLVQQNPRACRRPSEAEDWWIDEWGASDLVLEGLQMILINTNQRAAARLVMANFLKLSIANSPLQHACHRFPTTV